MLRVFWSWQSDSDRSTNKDFIKAALEEAVNTISTDMGLSEAERPTIDHDTKDEPGLVDIVASIFKKIDAADIFVGDITVIAHTHSGTESTQPKLVPNPNVLIELGYAMNSLGTGRTILQ